VTLRPPALDRGGIWAWRDHGARVVLRGQALAACNHARLLLGNDALMRVDPVVPDRELSLDRITPDQLRGRAEHISRRISQQVAQRFVNHTPRAYNPVFKEGLC
jgi:hypothetical protein